MFSRLPLLPWSLAVAWAAFASSLHAAPTPASDPSNDFTQRVEPLINKYCADCHGGGHHKGDVSFEDNISLKAIHADAKKWETVMDRVRSQEMPPDDADDLPSDAERAVISGWIERELFHVDPANPDPGRVTVHRLNRVEYTNTIRDLLGVRLQVADDFPADNSGYGFDNISDVLSLPPVLLEKYLTAARVALDEAIPTAKPASQIYSLAANLMEMGFNADGDRGDGYMPLGSLEEDGVSTTKTFAGGDYILRARAFATPKGKYASSKKPLSEQPIVLTVMLDDAIIGEWSIAAPEENPADYEMRVGLPSGKHRLAFVNHRLRGGENEAIMRNGRLGPLQGGTIYIKSVVIEGPAPTATIRARAKDLEVTGDGKYIADGARLLEHEGAITLKHSVPRAGEYMIRAQAYAQQAGPDPARMEFSIDGKPVSSFDVLAPAKLTALPGQHVFSAVLLNAIPRVYEAKVTLPAGDHRFSVAYINDYADPENKNPNLRDRNLIVEDLEIAATSEPAPVPEMAAPMQLLFRRDAKPPKNPKDAEKIARDIITEFARRAWRRPVDPSEIDELLPLYRFRAAAGEPLVPAVKLALQAVLVSPNFLFRSEFTLPDRKAKTPMPPREGWASLPIGEFALASRLSYFLWSSMPDEELYQLAAHGKLRSNLEAQVRRMMQSPKADALTKNFAGQWLEIRNLNFVAPDKEMFPDFDDSLRSAMREETETFFANIIQNDRSVLEFLTADYTFVNERLAKHYGIAGVEGDEFRRVSLAGTPRRGVLTQASILTITSNPNRTSPVKRGKWVLENILGTPPPPPPPNVPDLKNDGKPVTGTLRQQMEVHRTNAVCASCHARMDPIGFSLENFDAVGAYREKDGEFPVDAAGKLGTGESFNGAAELIGLLADHRRDLFVQNLAEKMLTYAIGRGVERSDRPAVDHITQELRNGQFKFSSLVLAVVKSAPFDRQRVDSPVAVTQR